MNYTTSWPEDTEFSAREMQVCQRLAPIVVQGDRPPPLWLIFYCMIIQLGCIISDFLEDFVAAVWLLIVLWMCCLVGGALMALWRMFRIHRLNRVVRKFQQHASARFNSQLGEIPTKEDRRAKFIKHCKARSRTDRPVRKVKDKRTSNNNKKKVRRRDVFKPQIGSQSITTAFANIANVQGIPIDDATLNRVENLGALFLAAKDCTTVTGFLSTVFLYMKTHYSKSVANLAATYMSSVLDAEFDAQTGEFGVVSDKEKPKWLLLLKDLQENWTLVIRNDGFKKISHVLSLCLALGLCDSADLDFRIGGMKLFSVGAYVKHATAIDLIDACFETICYFAEGGYACFERGSLKPLLYGNMENEEFEELYAKCLRCQEYARCGNLEKFENMSENDYEALLSQCIEKASMLSTTSKGVLEKNIFRRKTDVLRQWQATFRQTRVQGGLREAPYSIGIFGGTAVGKSTIANVLMITTLLHNNYCASDDRIVTLNEADKFMSNFRSYTNGVLIDDIGNTKAAFVERAPTSLMIQLVNNVRMYANMAEADMKGKVSVEPKVVIGTKNVKDTCATTYSNEPASITRRDRITLTCTVKEQYAVHNMLSEDRVRAAFPQGTPVIPDFWDITVEKSFPIPNDVKGKAATVGWEVVRWGDQPLQNIGLPMLVRWIGQDSKKFYAVQRDFVKKSNNLHSQLVMCPECNFPKPDVCLCERKDGRYFSRIDELCPTGFCDRCDAFHPSEKIETVADDVSVHSDGVPRQIPVEMPYTYTDDDGVPCRESPYGGLHYPPTGRDDEVYPQYREEGSYSSMHFHPQWGERIVAAMLPRYRKFDKWLSPRLTQWADDAETLTIDILIKRLDWLENSRWVCWTNWVPREWMNHPWMVRLVWFTHETELRKRIRTSYVNHSVLLVLCLFLTIFVHPILFVTLYFPLMGIKGVVDFEKQRLYEEVTASNEAMPQIFKMYRDRHIKWITGACIAIAALYAIAQIYKAFKVVPAPQGNIDPKAISEIVERDQEVNPWAGVKVSPMPCSEKSRTTTADRLERMVQDNLCHMLITLQDGGRTRSFECDAFFPKSNVAIVPRHMWKADEIKAKFTRHDPSLIGGNFECYLSRKFSQDIPNTDLSVVWVPNGGDWKDLTDYLPQARFSSVPARLTYKKQDGSCIGSKLQMEVGDIVTLAASFYGAKYNLRFETFEGLCMAPLVTETKGPMIGGFHLGGKNGQTRGCSGLLTKGEFDKAFSALQRSDAVILSKSAGTVPKTLYDIQYYESDAVHPRSPINFLPEGTNCKYYGTVRGRATYHTEVEDSVISKHVHDVCGVPQKWGGPKFREGYPWQASLQYSAKPSCGVEGDLLQRAAEDYTSGFLAALNKIPELKSDVKPLTEMQTVCGIDGKRFVDKMPPSTSVGYPLSGPKSQYLTMIEPENHPTHQCPAELDQCFWDAAKQMEKDYLAGERTYPIFKACLKDEPTKLTKDKVRVFQGAPMALQLLVRKYYLPVARVLSMLPLASECAVGVNAQGPEWDQLAKHVKKYGENRILAGDYSKYDLRMPAQVMFVAFRIMMDIAKECGYTDQSLRIMEGLATDICYPLMAYNGDLIQHIGSNPSGHNLTVYINSLVNAVLFRCAYFHVTSHRRDVPKFRDVCSLITYGDDAKSSVREDFPEFNHLTLADFLAARDMKFTMPDKEAAPIPYMNDEDCDLLKRANVYCEDTGMIMGALDEDSLFKSLHSNLKSKALTREQQAMQNIDGALREWFSHGRTVYEERRAQMQEVAKRAGIDHGCSIIHESYDALLDKWREKYQPAET